jgi:hypothetical protein
MRILFLLMTSLIGLGCDQPKVCRADTDCEELHYCYRAPLDLAEADGTEPGYPYEETGFCASDCISDADCFASARCTPKGICRDLTNATERQWTGYEPSLPALLDTRRFAPLLTCAGFIVCLLNCNDELEACQRCYLSVDPPSQDEVESVSNCLITKCPEGQTLLSCLGDAAICQNAYLVCQEDQ